MVKLAKSHPLKFIGLVLGLVIIYVCLGTNVLIKTAQGEGAVGAAWAIHVDSPVSVHLNQVFTVKVGLVDQMGKPLTGRTYGTGYGQFYLPGDAIKNVDGQVAEYWADSKNVREIKDKSDNGTGVYAIPVIVKAWPAPVTSNIYTLEASYIGQGAGSADQATDPTFSLVDRTTFTADGTDGTEGVIRYAPVITDKVTVKVPVKQADKPAPEPFQNVVTVRVKPVAQVRDSVHHNRKLSGLADPKDVSNWLAPTAVDNTGQKVDVVFGTIKEETVVKRGAKGNKTVATGVYDVQLIITSPSTLAGKRAAVSFGLDATGVKMKMSTTVNFSTAVEETAKYNSLYGLPYLVDIPHTPIIYDDPDMDFYWVGVTPLNAEERFADYDLYPVTDTGEVTNSFYMINEEGIRVRIKCLRLYATIEDPDMIEVGDPPEQVSLNVTGAEMFVREKTGDPAQDIPPAGAGGGAGDGANGTGYVMRAVDGAFNSPYEQVKYDMYPTGSDPTSLYASSLAEKQYLFWVHGKNQLGTWGYYGIDAVSIPVPKILSVDRTAPSIEITDPPYETPPRQVAGNNLIVAGTVNADTGGTFRSSLNSVELYDGWDLAWTDAGINLDKYTNTWSTMWDTLFETGDLYTIQARAIDTAGNMTPSGSYGTRDVVIDNTKPIANVTTPGDGMGYPTGTSTITVVGAAYDPPLLSYATFDHYTVEWAPGIKLSGEADVGWTLINTSTSAVGGPSTTGTLASWDVAHAGPGGTPLTEGPYSLRVRSWDKAGNRNDENPTGNTNLSYVFIDSSNPFSALTVPYVDGSANNWTSATIRGTGRDFMAVAGAQRYQEDAAGISYFTSSGSSGGWALATSTDNSYSGNAARYASTAGYYAQFTFTGTYVTWVSTKGPNRGSAQVWIDGAFVKTVNLNAPGTTYYYQQEVFSKTFDTGGTHTLKIVVSSGQVDVDAMDLYAGSGVDKVDVQIRRVSDGYYWHDSTDATPSYRNTFQPSSNGMPWLSSTVNSGRHTAYVTNWQYSVAAIPTRTQVDIYTRATDDTGNIETAPASTRVLVQTQMPSTTSEANPVTGLNGWYVGPPGQPPLLVIGNEPQSGSPALSAGATHIYYQWTATSVSTAPTSGYSLYSAPAPAPQISVDLDILGVGLNFEGTKRLWYYTDDVVGNVETYPYPHADYKRDSVAPTTPVFTAPILPDYYYQHGNVSLAGTTSDATSGVSKVEMTVRRPDGQYWQGGSNWSSSAYWFQISGTTGWSYSFNSVAAAGGDGVYNFNTRATDNAGIVSGTSGNMTLMIDNTVPTTYHQYRVGGVLQMTPDGENGWYKNDVSVSMVPQDATSGVLETRGAYTFNNPTLPGFQSFGGFNTNPDLNGTYYFGYYSTDNCSNVQTTVTANFKKDSERPFSTITTPTLDNQYFRQSISFAGTAWDPTSGGSPGSGLQRVEVSIQRNNTGLYWNGVVGAGATWTSPTPVWVTATGSTSWTYVWDTVATLAPDNEDFSLRSRGIDNAGGAQTTPPMRVVKVDNTAPVVTLVDPPDNEGIVPTDYPITATFNEQMNPSTLNSPVFDTGQAFTVKDAGGTSLPGTVLYSEVGPTCFATFTVTGLFNGPAHTATVSRGATDLAGNPLAVTHTPAAMSFAGQEPWSAISYSNLGTNWSTVADAAANGGNYKRSNTDTEYAEVTFTGTSIKWLSGKGPTYGIAHVWLDDTVDQGTFDLYAASQQYQQTIVNLTGLTDTTHKLKVVVTNTHNASSTDYYVDIDAFEGNINTTWRFTPAGVNAQIWQPVTGSRVYGQVPVMGQADGVAFQQYKLQYKKNNGTDTFHDFGTVHATPQVSEIWPSQSDWSDGASGGGSAPEVVTDPANPVHPAGRYQTATNIAANGADDNSALRLAASGTVWPYRKAITITNTGAQMTDYQIRVPVSFVTNKMKANFDDIRFTDSNGQEILSHWKESYTASSAAVFWTKVPVVPAGTPANPSTKIVYMYYGNFNAQSNTSNGANVFDRFDDFNDNSLNGSTWTNLSGAYESSGTLNFSCDAYYGNDWTSGGRSAPAVRLTTPPTGDFTARIKVSSFSAQAYTQAGISAYNSDTSAYLMGLENNGTVTRYQLEKIGGTIPATYYANSTQPKFLYITRLGSSYIFQVSDIDGTNLQQIGTTPYNDITLSNIVLFAREWASASQSMPGYPTVSMDDFIVQKFSGTATASTFINNVTVSSLGGEDTDGPLAVTYASKGSLVSSVFDAGAAKDWGLVKWTESLPTGTRITVQVRHNTTAADANPDDGGWSTWSAPITVSAGEQIPGFNAQYIQYKVNLYANSTATKTPVLNDITFYNGVLETWDTTSLPLGDGSYTIRLLVSDQLSGDPASDWNIVSPGKHAIAAEVVVNVENTSRPTSTITAPAAAPPTNLTAVQIKGTVDVTGTGYDEFPGVGKVEIRVRRSSDGLYWSGSGNNWSANADQWIMTTDTEGDAAYRYWKYVLDTTLQDTGSSVFVDGLYTIESKATDKAGAEELRTPDPYPLITVRIDNTAPTGSITFPASSSYVSGGFVSVDGGANDPPDDSNFLDYKLEYKKTGATTWTTVANDNYAHPRLPAGGRSWRQTTGADFSAGTTSGTLANANGTTLLAGTVLALGTTTTSLTDTIYMGGYWAYDGNSGLYTLVFGNRTLSGNIDFMKLKGEIRLAPGSWLPAQTFLLAGTTTTHVGDTTNLGGTWSSVNGLYTLTTTDRSLGGAVTLQGALCIGGRVEMDRYLFTEAFDAAGISGTDWVTYDGGTNMSVSGGAVSVNGPSGTQQYLTNTPVLVTQRNFDRSTTQRVEADFRFSSFTSTSSGNAGTYFGWKNTTGSYDLAQYAHAFWIFNGSVYVYNNGASANTGQTLAAGTTYRLRVDLKTGGGATYYFSADGGATWTTAYDTAAGTATPLKAGFTNNKYTGSTGYPANMFTFDTVTIHKYVTSPSTFTSAVYDAGASINWNSVGQIKWTEGGVNGSTSDVTLMTRTGSSATAGDQNWTGWSAAVSNPAGQAITSLPGRYIQYRITETYTGSYAPSVPLPAVGDVTISYTGGTGANQLEFWNTSGLQEGDYTLRLTVTDKAGNTNTTPIESNPVTLDKTAPHASLDTVGTLFGGKRYIRANLGLTGTADDGMWTNKRPIAITNPTGAAQTDYQVKVPVTFASGMKADFSDLRFTDGTNAKLAYWIEAYTASSSATVWVKVPSLPSPGGTTIYMTYGNSAADVTGQSFNKVMLDANDMSNPYRQDLSTTGAIGLWRMETPTTSGLNYVWADATGNPNHDAVLDNGAWSFTQYGHMQGTAAGYFDGIDDKATIANSAALQGLTGNATFEFWIYPQNVSGGRTNPLDKSYGGQFAFTLETNGSLSYYHGTAKSSGNYTSFAAVPAGSLENNNWYHVAVVRDNTAKTLKGYLNGILVNQTTYTINPGAATDNMTFGIGYTGVPFKGLLDEVRISNSAVTSDQIMKDVGIRKWSASEPVAGAPGANSPDAYAWGNFHHYELTYSGPESGTIVPPGGTSPITGGTLGTWNTRAVQDGDNYAVKLYDIDLANNTATTSLTGLTVDNTPPRVTSTVPAGNETFVDDRISQKAYFTESIRAATIDSPAASFTKKLMNPPNTLVAGTVKYAEIGGKYYATFTQTLPPLTYDEWYTDTITPAVKDQAGNPLAIAYEENDVAVTYTGTGWTDAANASASGGAYKWTATTNDDVTVSFNTDTVAGKGTAVAWVGQKGPNRGIARVYLDGADVGTIDQYSATTLWQQPLYKTGDLPTGPHTLRIVATGTKNGASSDYRIDADAFWIDFDTVWNFQVAGVEVGITSPTPNQRLKGTVAVNGTADGSVASFQDWTLDYAPHGTAGWTTIATSTTRVVNAKLADWVTPASGQYDLRLTVNDNTLPTPRYKQKTITVTVDNTAPTVSVDRLTYFRDTFDNRDAANWEYAGANLRLAVPFALTGENVVRRVGPGGSSYSELYRPSMTLKDRDQVAFDFRMDSGSTNLYASIEANDNQGQYMRWGLVSPAPGNLYAESGDKTGWNWNSLAVGDISNKWFRATLSIDDAANGTFSCFVYEIANPGNNATFTKAMPRGLTWRFHSWIMTGTVYLDNYEEVRPAGATVTQGRTLTIAGTAGDALAGIDNVQVNVDGRAWWEPVDLATTVDACDAITGWVGGQGSVAVNTTTKTEGTGALNLAKTGNTSADSYFYKTIGATDMRNKRVNVWLYVRDNTALNKVADVQMYVGGSNWYLYKQLARTDLQIGWNTISLDMMNPEGVWTNGGIGTPSVSAVTTIRLDVDTNNVTDLYGSGEFIMDRWALSPSTRIDQSTGTTTTGLVGDWHLDENTGTVAIDSTANNNGAVSGSGFWTASGRYGASGLLGSGDDMVTVNETNTSLRLGTQQSVETWFRFGATAADWVRLVGKGNGNNRNYGLWLATNGTILYQFQNASATYYSVQTTTAVNDGAWHHILGTYNGSTMKIYVDGLEAATGSISGVPVTSADPLTIGYGNAGAALIGTVDEAKVYNVCLTSDQAVSRYTEGPVTSGSPYVSYQGNWGYVVNPLATYMSGGGVRVSNKADDTATITFTGTSVTWIGSRGPARGVAQVFIDGVRVTDGDTLLTGDTGTAPNGLPNMSGFDLYSVAGQYRQLLFTRSGLSAGQHTMTIKVTGAKNGSATDASIDIDAIDLGNNYPWTYTFSTSGWSAGAHTVTARTFDRAGNTAGAPANYTVNIDTADPVVALTSPADGIWSNGSAFDIKGRATDSDFNYYLLEYGLTASPSYWFPVNSNPRYYQVTGTAPNDYLGKFKIPYTLLDPADQFRASWDRGSIEGWTAAGMSSTWFTTGAIAGTTNSTDANLTSPGVSLDSLQSKVLHVRMKNSSTASSAQFYWSYSFPYTGSYTTGGQTLQLGEAQPTVRDEGVFDWKRSISWPLGPASFAGNWVDYRLNMKTGQVHGTVRREGPTATAGTWTTETNPDASEGTSVYTTAAGASASYTFSNNNFAVYTTKGPDRGKARVYFDDILIQDGDSKLTTDNPNDINKSGLDLYAPVILGQQLVYSKTAIPDVYTASSPRTLTSGASLQYQMNLTAGSVLTVGSTLKIGTIAYNAGDVANIGGYWTGSGPYTLIGTRMIINSNVGLQGPLTVMPGTILLNGCSINTTSKTSSLVDTQNVGGSWAFSNTHTIKLEYTGEKNSLSTGTRIDADAYEDTSLLQDYPGSWTAAGFWAGTITQIRLDPTSLSSSTFAVDYIAREPSDGVYKVKLTGFDRAGRSATTQRTINIDTMPPKCILTSPTNMQFLASGTNISVVGNAGDYTANGVQSGVNKVEVRVIAGVNGLTANPGPWQLASGTTSWSKTMSIADGWYGIQARATDNAGNIRESNTVYVTVDNTAPPVPRLRAVTSKTAGGILLSWTPVKDEGSGVDYYVVYRNNVPITDKLYYPDMRTIDTVETALTSKNFGGAGNESFRKFYGCNAIDKDGFGFTANANVRYAVRAVDAAGNYSARYSLAVYYDTRPPDAPGNPAASIAGVTNTGLLSWSTSADNQTVAEYRIYRDTSPGFVAPDETKQVGSCDVSDPGSGATTATKFYDPNLSWDQDYYYKVVAFDDMMNYSSPSAEVHVKTPASRTDFDSALPHLAYSSSPAECALCHRAHTAKGEALINETYEAKLCFTCHDGSGSNSPTKAEFDFSPSGAHRVKDELYPTGKLSCIDCHNPHLNTEAASVDNFDDDKIGTQPDGWTYTGGTWATVGDPTHAELRQSDAGAASAFARKDTGLVAIDTKGGSFSTQVKLNSDGQAYLSIAGDGSPSSGLVGSITRTGSSAVFTLTDGTTTRTANFTYNEGTLYRINLKVNPERWVQGTITAVTKADMPDGHDTITDTPAARCEFIATASSLASSWVGIGTGSASADFDLVKINNPGMLQTRYREFTQTSGSSYGLPDDRVLTEAFCLSCHGTSNDNPGGSQLQYYTSIHNPEMGGMQGQTSDQDLTNYVRANPSQVSPRWQTIRDEWKDLKTNPAYVLLATGTTIGDSLKNTSNGCFYCHGYHGLQFYYRTQKGEEELCYNCHGRTANKARDNWNVYQQYNGFVQENSPFLTYTGTWMTDESANFGGNAVKYAIGGVIIPPWYNSSWTRRKLITINNPNAAITNYQVKLVIAKEAEMKADYSDIRFATSDGATMRTFWTEKYDASSATVWVSLPQLDNGNTSNNNKLYVYYGNNGAATASDMAGTFLYADNFTSTTIDPSWSTVGSVTLDGSAAGWATLNSIGATNPAAITHSYPVQTEGYVVEAKVKFPTVWRQRPRLLRADNTDPTGIGDYGFGDNQFASTWNGTTTYTDYYTSFWGTASPLVWDGTQVNDYALNTEMLTQYVLQPSPQQFTWRYYTYAGYNAGGAPIRTHSTAGGATNTYAKIQFTGSESDNSDWQIDWVRVRKNLAIDPTISYAAPDGTTSASVSFTFTGTEFSWASTKGANRGIARVYIDNVAQGDIDLSLPPEQGFLYNVTVFNKQYLSLAPHTVVIAAQSGRVDIDAVQGGTNGSRHGLTIRDAQIKCTSCHGQRAMTDRHVYEGYATSIIANPANIKQYWSDMRNVNKTINDYCNTCHKEADTRGRVLRETHTSSKIVPYTVKYPPIITTTSANGFDRTGYTLGDIYPIQENFTGVTKSPLAEWTIDSPGTDDYEGGEDVYSSTFNAYVEYTFTGTYCAYVARYGPDSGIAQVFIDGQRYTDGNVSLPGDNPNEYSGVDLYSAVPAYRIVAASRSSLPLTSHTIRVVVTNSKNALSAGYRVDVDAFKYAVPRVGHYLFAPQGPATTIISVADPTHFTVANATAAELAVGNTITIDFADIPHPAQQLTIIGLNGNAVEVSSALNASHTVDCTVSNTTKSNCAGVCHDSLPDYIKNSQEAKTRITCVTCHHPHATPYQRVVRWQEDTKTGAVVTEGACLHCHNGSVKYNY